MGSFYGSVHVRTTDRNRVRSALEELSESTRRFLLGPVLNGWVGIYPDGSGQDLTVARDLADQLEGELIALLCHDDDIFAYEYFRNGESVDQYNSIPDYFGDVSETEKQRLAGRPETFSHLFSDSDHYDTIVKRMAAQAENRDVFVSGLFEEFAKALGIRNAATSYEYLKENEETEDIEGWKQFIHIPNLSSEKAKKKAAKAAITKQKELLTKQGKLLAECGGHKGRASPSPHWCTAPAHDGFLVAWSSYTDTQGQRLPLELRKSPWSGGPQATPWAISPKVFSMELSPSGRYLAVGHASGDWKATLWDLEENRLVAESPQVRVVQSVGFLADESAMYSVSSMNGKGRIVITPVGPGKPIVIEMSTAKLAAAHPKSEWLVIADERNRLNVLHLPSARFVRSHAIGGTYDLTRQLMTGIFASHSNADSGSASEPTSEEKKKLDEHSANLTRTIEEAKKLVEKLMGKKGLNLASQSTEQTERGTEIVFRLQFDHEGKRMFVATSVGVRVYAWQDVLEAEDLHPTFSFDVPATIVETDRGEEQRGGYVYSLDYDLYRNRLLFGGLSGQVYFLDLESGKCGVLLELPEFPPILRLALSRDCATLALTCSPDMYSRKATRRGLVLQFWDYDAITKGNSTVR